ncbi:hypothetical protein V6N13_013972 [Hibiscus sabdariffa]
MNWEKRLGRRNPNSRLENLHELAKSKAKNREFIAETLIFLRFRATAQLIGLARELYRALHGIIINYGFSSWAKLCLLQKT